MNIPIGMLMDVLVGDGMRLGGLIGLNTEDRPMVHAFFGDRDELFGEKYIATASPPAIPSRRRAQGRLSAG